MPTIEQIRGDVSFTMVVGYVGMIGLGYDSRAAAQMAAVLGVLAALPFVAGAALEAAWLIYSTWKLRGRP
jgi:hypothetical protein